MEYILPGTKGLIVECDGVEFKLMEDIKTEDEDIKLLDAGDYSQVIGIVCFSAKVAPICEERKGWQYEANWSVMDEYGLDMLKSGDLSNPAWFDGIVATREGEDNAYLFSADGKMV